MTTKRCCNAFRSTVAIALSGIITLSSTPCGGGSSEYLENRDSNNDIGRSPGLDVRPVNTTCVAPSRPINVTNVKLQRAFPNLSFDKPVAMLQPPTDNSRWYVIEKGGKILWFDATNESTNTTMTYLDYTGVVDSRGEGGMLGMTFHPSFANNGQVFISYTLEGSGTSEMQSIIARLISTDGNLTLSPDTEDRIITIDQPFTNHNGGNIAFGPDGFLYIGLGDGGSGNDPNGEGQNPNTLLGSMLRLDVDGGSPYKAPDDNPFINGDGRQEVYAYGLRNPWRWGFDRTTGALWLADVGQNAWEEVNLIQKGGNYGWRCYEGTRFNTSVDTSSCPPKSAFTFPIAQYDHREGTSITGGFVYRGNLMPTLNGIYLFGDFGSGTIWGLFPEATNLYRRTVLLNTGLRIVSFGQNNEGELYVVDFNGTLHRIVADSNTQRTGGPANALSETGCVNPANPQLPASGVIPYDILEPFWSDGANKERFVALPENATIAVLEDGDMELPPGSVTMKHFRINGQLIETRLFVRHDDGGWAGYSYEWNDALTDAFLVDASGKTKQIGAQPWRYPSRAECTQCHSQAANFSLGIEALQLNRDFTYPSTGLTANQLNTWEHIKLFSSPLKAAHRQLALTQSSNLDADLNLRARSYLHSNCAHCHHPRHNIQSKIELGFHVDLSAMKLCNVSPSLGDLGIGDARLLAPGEPERSVLLQRIKVNNLNRMPPIASNKIDSSGVNLLEAWISSISGCP